MSGNLSGRVAVVTGGASGIGAACVRRLVSDGAQVVLADVQDEPACALSEQLGHRCQYVRTDVTVEDDIARLVDGTVERHGSLDVFFSNAGVFGAVGPIARTDTRAADLTIAVNLRGTLLCLKHAVRVMQVQGSGSIIATASPGGVIGGVGPHVYSATKAGVIGLVRAVAAEARNYGIRVNSIIPGAIVSPMTADVVVDDPTDLAAAAAVMGQGAPIGRPGVPDDLAGAVSFLAGDDAAYITGSELLVDAGYTHAWGPASFAKGKFADPGIRLEGGRRS